MGNKSAFDNFLLLLPTTILELGRFVGDLIIG